MPVQIIDMSTVHEIIGMSTVHENKIKKGIKLTYGFLNLCQVIMETRILKLFIIMHMNKSIIESILPP